MNTQEKFEHTVRRAHRFEVFWTFIAIFLFLVAVAFGITSCTYAHWENATVISVLQKRRLTVTSDPATGKIQSVQYSSGSDPIIIQTPYGEIKQAGQ